MGNATTTAQRVQHHQQTANLVQELVALLHQTVHVTTQVILNKT